VHADVLASQSHLANVIDRDYAGLGAAAVRRDRRVWVVQVLLAK
jgi:hypothetical protein